MILICTSLMTNNVEHIFTCPLAIHLPSLVKYPFEYFTHFCIGLLIFSISLYTREISLLSMVGVANIFSSLSLEFVEFFFPQRRSLFSHS